jgi:acyl-homoserine-lactone acylase
MTWLKYHWKQLLLTLAILLAIAVAIIFFPVHEDLSPLKARAAGHDVRILRDTYGVPHIFGKTDADASYGLAYAHAEDDFLTIQQVLLAARGRLATVYGADSAPVDYSVQFLRIWDVVDANYDTLSPDTRALVEAYADGLNVYAAYHPDATLPGLFPVTGKDIVAASVQKSPLFFGLDKTLAHLFSDNPEVVPTPTAVDANSNAFAISPVRTSDAQTYLAVNSHQPWTGPVAWYEAHVHSDQGWDMSGGLFPVSPVIIHGHNRDLGWAFTVNHPDLIDVYRLTINPDNPNQYLYDGQWRDLEVRQAKLIVKIIGNLKFPVTREALWSVYGPAVRNGDALYAVRFAGYGQVGIWEQLYRMNKASNFDEWQAAVRTRQLPTFNIVYADRTGNIYYLYNGLIPSRSEGYDWSNYLPGDTSATLWTDYVPFEALPQVKNPSAGFVQNANGTPYRTTLDPDNPKPADYPPSMGVDTLISNRSLRMLELFGADDSITPEEFVQYKYDMHYSQDSEIPRWINLLASAPPPSDPNQQAALELLKTWDLQVDPESRAAAVMVYTIAFLYQDHADAIKGDRLGQSNVDLAILQDSFGKAVKHLMDHFGVVDVEWQRVNRLQRGTVDLGLGGGPDILHAVYGIIQKDGRLAGNEGDSFVQLTVWGKNGSISTQSIHQFGSATLDEASPHYADQSPLFVRRELKSAWFDETDIRAHLEREYVPGQEVK